MNIAEKIEEIRMQPEHIRLRYVWASVIVSMLFIFIIWLFSISTMFQKKEVSDTNTDNQATDVVKKIQDLKQNAPSLSNLSQKIEIESVQEGIIDNSDQTPTERLDSYSNISEN